MQTSAVEIERVVQIVIERLRTAARAENAPTPTGVPIPNPTATVAPKPTSNELRLTDAVIALASVRDRLQDVQIVRVPCGSIVTPAVADLLRTKNIQLIRAGSRTSTLPGEPEKAEQPSLLVCGSAAWLSRLPKQLDKNWAMISACADAAAGSLVELHLAAGGLGAVWVTPTPYAAISNFHLTSRSAAIYLPNLSELAQAMNESQPKLIVIGANVWTPAAVGNLVRTWSRSL